MSKAGKQGKQRKKAATEAAATAVAETAEASAETTGGVEGEENSTLSMKDLQAIGRIFELATQRGAFRANEMTVVGTVYDKLNGFLTHVAATQEAATGEAGEAGEAGEETTDKMVGALMPEGGEAETEGSEA